MARASTNGSAKSEDLSVQVAILRDDVAALTKTLGELGQAKAADAQAQAAAMGHQVKQSATEAADHASEALRTGAADAQRMARENPGTALGIAAGLGFLIGFMTARR
ncbi:MAG: DUF883 C-terminal domain-containing protein [Pseudomonadota bacterium]